MGDGVSPRRLITGLRPSCNGFLLQLARARNEELQLQNEALRSELEGARRLLDEALALAARPVALLPSSQPASNSAPTTMVAVEARGFTGNACKARAGNRSTVSSTAARGAKVGAVPADEHARQQQLALAARRAVSARQREMAATWAAAAIRLQSSARGMLLRMALRSAAVQEAAAIRMQAAVRGNAARGIAERRRWHADALAPRRLVHVRPNGGSRVYPLL